VTIALVLHSRYNETNNKLNYRRETARGYVMSENFIGHICRTLS